MIDVKVIFENGDSFATRINATREEAERYYLGRYFNLGAAGDNMQRCTAVEILPGEK